MVYEAFLLTAVELCAVAVFALATANRQGAFYLHAKQFLVFFVAAAYFIHFWTDSGHTLAMKTWRVKVVKPGHARLPLRAAALRFVLGWGWFLPALVACYALRLSSPGQAGAALLAGVLAWAMTAFLNRDRQFLHDRLAGTRVILLPTAAKQGASAPAAGRA